MTSYCPVVNLRTICPCYFARIVAASNSLCRQRGRTLSSPSNRRLRSSIDLKSSCVLVSEDSCELHRRGNSYCCPAQSCLLDPRILVPSLAVMDTADEIIDGGVQVYEFPKLNELFPLWSSQVFPADCPLTVRSYGLGRTNRFSPFGTVGYSEFPAYSKIYSDNYNRQL